ncbi:hypothetical protein P168DRAFT_314236 [Aspergillus campestris IBT 28561]|uniref:Uncharacterized protein n=1 Tax=Aspergillus campestris (strain IBT 28561) TaxID=1392248 RepID=A0A2I1DDZ4_ASPC2|nr:uncharacterized protein P168DRAFT_314236 [Aspergillus campestris IBT 28561]PKY08109.1 hypothetical protein P168DRAFT_314236 [Aspergillus campestris IBT 28561]
MTNLTHYLLLSFSCLLWIQCTAAFKADPVGVVYEAAPLAKREASTGSLGGVMPAIEDSGDSERPYAVNGDTFPDKASAAERSCNNQFDSCQKAANSDPSSSFSVQDCQSQLDGCMETSDSPSSTSSADPPAPTSADESTVEPEPEPTQAQTMIPYDDEYDLICDL